MHSDADIIRIARQIEGHNQKISTLVGQIKEGGHPNADEIFQNLRDNGFDNAASADSCVLSFLTHPQKWEERWRREHPISSAIDTDDDNDE